MAAAEVVKADPVHDGLHDFYLSHTDEPHATRRKAILAAHPEVKELMGFDPRTKWVVLFMWSSQLAVAWYVRESSWLTIAVAAYVVGAVFNHSMLLAIHEMSHNLLFKTTMANQLFALFVNVPMLLPSAITFKRYHQEHHKYQGYDSIDVDVPSNFEGRVFQGVVMKAIWVFFQGFWYAFRPLLIRPKPASGLELANWVVCLSFDTGVVMLLGWRSLAYFALSDLFGLGMHPVAGHFIAEHYVFGNDQQETYSYYGPLKWLIFNVGYHVEHHDFPNIPGSRLPKLREIAAEFYDTLPYHTSYTWVIWKFITDPKITPFSRVKRFAKELGKEIDAQ
eukprot:a841351_819.p1 GENE.a841351_819~~a841351_819.p1  ORF type:complete len:346 (-),score=123.49 a841351_819:37-1041(-)